MGRIDFFWGLLVVCLLFVCAPEYVCPASNPDFAVSGTVFADGSSQRLVNAAVAICDAAGNSLQQVATNDFGEFSFEGLRSARYILRVQAAGFQTAEIHIDLSFAAERGFSVVLKPTPKAIQASSSAQTISVHELSMPQAARDLVASGKKKLYIEHNSKAALADFQSASEKAPRYYEAYFQEGMAYLSLQNSGEAEKLFRKSVEMSDKKCADADLALGALLLQQNQVPEGESLLRLGLASNPLSWPGQFELAKLELSRDHIDSALSAAERARALAPQQAVVYRLLAAIHLRQRNYLAVIADIDAYLQLDSNSAAATRAKELRAEAQRQVAHAPETAVAVK
jgi:Tfp pilus assembly protein PilF